MGTASIRQKQYQLGTLGLCLLRGIHSLSTIDRITVISNITSNATACLSFTDTNAIHDGLVSAETGYGIWARTYDSDNTKNPLIALENLILNEIIPPVSNKTALDIACGTGRNTSRLAHLGYKVAGTDLTVEMLKQAEHILPQANFRKGEFCKLPFESDSFDLVFSSLALTHEPNLDIALNEMARVLHDDGKIIIVDVHPFQVLLGSHATIPFGNDQIMVVKNYIHTISDYLRAFTSNGIKVVHLHEPIYTSELLNAHTVSGVGDKFETAAFRDTPALVIWELTKNPV